MQGAMTLSLNFWLANETQQTNPIDTSYITEDGTDFYTTEDGSSPYVPEA